MSEITEGNKIIAEFMGMNMDAPNVWSDKETGSLRILGEYRPHADWNELMAVIEKIEQAARVDIYGKACKISQPQLKIDIAHINEFKIMAVWISSLEFIKWLNKLKSAVQ